MKHGWEIKKFENCIGKIPKPQQLKTSDYKLEGKFPIVSQEACMISGFTDAEELVYHTQTPVVVFGDHTRILKYVDFDFVVGADGVKILVPTEDFNCKFFYYYLTWYDIPSLGYSRHYKLLKEINIPIPPLPIQERIVSELDCINGILEKKREQIKELDALAQSIFYDMFGDPIQNEKGWEVKKLGESFLFQQGMQVPVEEQYEEKEKGMERFLRIIDFTQGNEPPRYVNVTSEKHMLRDGEVAIVRYGSPGFVCFGKEGIIANNLFKIIPNLTINSTYFIYWLNSEAFQSVVKGNQYGAALQAIKFSTINGIGIILPPLPLQQSFATKIEAIEKQKELIKRSITEVETLLASRMQYYFGE